MGAPPLLQSLAFDPILGDVKLIAPVIIQGIAVVLPVVLHLVELENGHQLHGVDPQGLQIGYLLLQQAEH